MGYKIAIDGPAGAGKTTVAKLIAQKLGFVYVDTGAMYRAFAVYLLDAGICPGNSKEIGKACGSANVAISYEQGVQRVCLNGVDITDRLRGKDVGEIASESSVLPKVRLKFLELQREIAEKENVVMEGRDIGTKVLPGADLKIYLTASAPVRAKRRFDQLKAKGDPCDRKEIEEEIARRDERDQSRVISPLKQAKDALMLDSTDMSADEVADRIVFLFKKGCAKKTFDAEAESGKLGKFP